MGYSRSPRTVEAMREVLQPLIDNPLCVWETEPGGADKFAYKLREAFYVAMLHPDQFPELSRTARNLKVVVESDRIVRTVLRSPRASIRLLASASDVEQSETMPALPPVASSEELVQQVAQRWADAQKLDHDGLYLPKLRPTTEQLRSIWAWAEQHQLLLFEHDGDVTLKRFDPDIADFAWRPES